MNHKVFIREAKHSFAILLGFIGKPDTECNLILLKWPDAMDSMIEKNEEKFLCDMSHLICRPLFLIAKSLVEILSKHTEVNMQEVYDTMKFAELNPIESKENLIRLCNSMIFKIRSFGVHYEYIKNSEGER